MLWSGKNTKLIVSGTHIVTNMDTDRATASIQKIFSKLPFPETISDNNLTIPEKTIVVIKKKGICQNRCQ
jgi:hypothetical protein